MAQRFGGKYSPDADDAAEAKPRDARPAYQGARVSPVGARSNVLFLPPVLLAFMSLTDGAVGLATGGSIVAGDRLVHATTTHLEPLWVHFLSLQKLRHAAGARLR